MKRTAIVLSVVLLALGSQAALATPYHVSIHLGGLGGADFQLQVALYDNSGAIGDSWARIDNVVLGPVIDDFETGTLGAFDASFNPASVQAVAGSLDGTGSYLMRIDEDPLFSSTIVFRNYSSPGGSLLSFDLDWVTSGVSGPMGQDELVLSLLDPQTFAPLVSGLTGLGDVLAISGAALQSTDMVSVTVIPAPAALLLGLLGVAGVGIWRQRVNIP